jgi:hypothetical protein
MALGYDGTIRIDSRIDAKGFNAGIKGMIGALKSLAAAVAAAFAARAAVDFGKSAVAAATELSTAVMGLQSVLQGQGRSFSEAKKFIDEYTRDGLIPAANALKAYQNLTLRGYSDEQIQQTLNALKDSAAFGRRAGLSMGDAVQTATEGLRNENSILVDNAGVTKNVAKMWQDYAKAIGKTTAELTQAEKIQAEVNGIMEETRFQAGDAAKISNTYAGMVSRLNAVFTRFKEAVGKGLQAALKAIIPLVIRVLEWLTRLAEVFNQVMVAIFGGEETGAGAGMGAVADDTQAAADAQGELAENTEKAKKAAKGALAAFDELNVLQRPEDETGEEKAPEAPIGPVDVPIDFEPPEAPSSALEAKIRGFFTRLQEVFAPALEAFGRLKEALEPLGKTIWEGLQWAWENILVPLGEWVVTDALPVFLDLLAAGADALNTVLIALQPAALWLWENFLKPVAEWTADKFLGYLKWLTEGIQEVTKGIEEGGILGGFVAGWTYVWETIKEQGKAAWGWITKKFGELSEWFRRNVTEPVGRWFSGVWKDIEGWAGDAWKKIEEIWKNVSNWFDKNVLQPIKDLFGPAWETIGILVNNAWATIKYVWELVSAWFRDNVTEPVKKWFSDAWGAIETAVNTAWTNIQTAWQGVSKWFQENVVDPVKGFFTTAWGEISGAINGAWETVKQVWETVSGWFDTNVIQPIRTAWETAFGGLVEFFRGVLNGLIDVLNNGIQFIVGGINGIIDLANTAGTVIPGWMTIPYVVAPQIPRLATGAVIPPNSEFLAVLGDQRAGKNIEAPEGLIRQIIQEEIGKVQADIRIEFQGTLGALVRELQPHIAREDVRIGRSLITGGV